MAKETNVQTPVNNNNNNDIASSPTPLAKEQVINNQKLFSGGAKPIPIENLKCNILKAKVEEELSQTTPPATKLTNQMFVVAANHVDDDECSLLSSLNAATFISVVNLYIFIF